MRVACTGAVASADILEKDNSSTSIADLPHTLKTADSDKPLNKTHAEEYLAMSLS